MKTNRTSNRFQALALLVGSQLLFTASVHAQSLLNDDFESGNPGYYRNAFAGQVFTTDDSSGISTGDALQHNPNGATYRKLVRNFSSYTLANEGDSLTLTFDLRYPSGAPSANSQAFRFGLYNSNGTTASADGDNVTGNDFGYYAALGTGGTNGRFIFETAANGFLGGGTNNQLAGAGSFTINDATKRNVSLTLERVATGLSIDLSIDGGSNLNIVDTTVTTYTFDEFGLGFGAVSSTDDNYRIDNVSLVAVPEVSSFALTLGLSSLALLFIRRRL